MKPRVFVDTNVWIYADDANAAAKMRRCRTLLKDLIASGQVVTSTQVLQEFFYTATRKLAMDMVLARAKVELMTALELVVIRPELILGAIDLTRLHSLSFWDALVVRSALAGGCTKLLSEDLQHGQHIEGLRIENPFVKT